MTTAAAIWESAAIGVAAAAGLLLLAGLVTVLHFIIVLAIAPLAKAPDHTTAWFGSDPCHLSRRSWDLTAAVAGLRPTPLAPDVVGAGSSARCSAGRSLAGAALPGEVAITMTLSGVRVVEAGRVLAEVDGVTRIDQLDDDSD